MAGLHRKNNCQSRGGVVLLVTLVLMVVLSMISYALTIRVAAQRHRNQYIIDYSSARYGCDSAMKYAIASLEDINNVKLIARPNEPDFSDLFALSDAEYKDYLSGWATENHDYNDFNLINDYNDFNWFNDYNDFNLINDYNDFNSVNDYNDVNSMTVRGPYGPAWPLITKPVEIMIGTAKVKIEIEDENAKYPIGWMMMDNKETKQESVASFETFCEWMGIDKDQIISFEEQFDQVREIKPFKLDLQPIKVNEQTATLTIRSRRGRVRRHSRTKTITIPATVHIKDFARLYHSSLIDMDVLARPTVASDDRNESALKYAGLWGCGQVNINTAPRHVLEAVFMFGGDSVEIAERIIQRRRIKPFSDINELKGAMLGYSDSILKCEKYITTVSKFFTIRVTAVSGVAKASAVATVMKEGNKLETIGMISG